MQNKYVGDFGDFGKYAMLKHLARTGLSLGINWYLTPDEIYCNDGKHTAYLKNDRMQDYDSKIYRVLKELVCKQRRDVKEIESSDILPPDTVYFSLPLDWANAAKHNTRTEYRAAWHYQAMEAMNDRDLVFLDPDNGLQVKSVSLTGRKGNKYIGLNELHDYVSTGKSIVFYNHRERKKEAEYLQRFLRLHKEEAYIKTKLFGIKFSGGTVRDYIFLLHPEHKDKVLNACYALLDSVWQSHFKLLDM